MSAIRAISALLLLLFSHQVASAAVVYSIDDFQDGTTQGWAHGAVSPNPPENVADEGPAGSGDHSLQVISAGGGGPGGRLAVFNRESKWTGNYTSAGITGITVDVNNVGADPMSLRVGIGIGGGGGGTGRYVTSAILVSPGSGWRTLTWSVLPSDFTQQTGSTSVADALTMVSELRFVSSVAADFRGDPIDAVLHLDNVVAVPEPAGSSLVALGAAGLAVLRRRRRSGRRRSDQCETHANEST